VIQFSGPTHTSAYSSNAFVTTWQTDNPWTSSDTQVTIPVNPNFTYDYDIDCDDDGTFEMTGATTSYTCTYPSAGNYTIAIEGTYPSFYLNNEWDKDKLLTVEQWGTQIWQTLDRAFWGASNLTTTSVIDTPDLSNVTNMSFMFLNAISFNQDISDWNMSWVESILWMFQGASSFNTSLIEWDTSSVINMLDVFRSNTAFNQDLSSWNTSNVTNMGYMFYWAIAFNNGWQPLVQSTWWWNTSNVSSMSNMFRNATSFNQDISSWDIPNVSNMSAIFDQSALSTDNYDNTLIWRVNQSNTPSDITLGANWLTYCDSSTARSTLINQFNWDFNDSGIDPNCQNLSETEIICSDGTDDDWDWLIDCLDSDCNGIDWCEYNAEVSCDDTIDNDWDWLSNCNDSDCSDTVHCLYSWTEMCSDTLVSHWDFNEWSWTNISDNKWNNNWTLSNESTRNSNCILWNCLDLSWGDYSVSIPHDTSLNQSSSFTASLWINPNTLNWYQAIYSKWITPRPLSIWLRNDKIEIRYTNIDRQESGHITSNTGVVIDSWSHIALSYDWNNMYLYINGVLDNNETAIQAEINESNDLYFWQRWDNSYYYDWKIDEIKIFDTYLPEQAIQDIYSNSCSQPTWNNTPPTTTNDTYTLSCAWSATIDVLANDNDLDDDPLTVTLLSQPDNWTATVENNQVVITWWSICDTTSFTYQIDDGNGWTTTWTITQQWECDGCTQTNEDLALISWSLVDQDSNYLYFDFSVQNQGNISFTTGEEELILSSSTLNIICTIDWSNTLELWTYAWSWVVLNAWDIYEFNNTTTVQEASFIHTPWDYILECTTDYYNNLNETDEQNNSINIAITIPEIAQDTDNDGIPNATDTDVDGDNIDNDVDDDDDGDTIPDTIEWTEDTDNDGLPNNIDTDSDNDGIDDNIEGSIDTDSDTIPDFIDDDSDDDGMLDSEEHTAPNNGDANFDTIRDAIQNGVKSFIPTQNTAVTETIDVKTANIWSNVVPVVIDKYTQTIQKDTYDHIFGLNEIELNVDIGWTATVVIYYHGIDDIESYVYRKYVNGLGWNTFPITYHNTNWVPSIQLVLVDWGAGDSDWIANGVIKDPGWLWEVITTQRSWSTKIISKTSSSSSSSSSTSSKSDSSTNNLQTPNDSDEETQKENSDEHNSSIIINQTWIDRHAYFVQKRQKEQDSNLGNIAENLYNYSSRRKIEVINKMKDDKMFVQINRLDTWNHMLFFTLLEANMEQKGHTAAGSLVQTIQWNVNKYSQNEFENVWLEKEVIYKSIQYILKHY